MLHLFTEYIYRSGQEGCMNSWTLLTQSSIFPSFLNMCDDVDGAATPDSLDMVTRSLAVFGQSPWLWSCLTRSRRITCCRTWKAPVCPQWPAGWAQGVGGSGRGSLGGAARLKPWSPVEGDEHTYILPGSHAVKYHFSTLVLVLYRMPL